MAHLLCHETAISQFVRRMSTTTTRSTLHSLYTFDWDRAATLFDKPEPLNYDLPHADNMVPKSLLCRVSPQSGSVFIT